MENRGDCSSIIAKYVENFILATLRVPSKTRVLKPIPTKQQKSLKWIGYDTKDEDSIMVEHDYCPEPNLLFYRKMVYLNFKNWCTTINMKKIISSHS